MFDPRRAWALRVAVQQLHVTVGALDPGALTGPEAVELLDIFARAERLAAAGKALLAVRAAETNQWRRDGDRSPEAWLSRRTGSGFRQVLAEHNTKRAS